MTSARSRARRTMLSALAGGGLTVVGLGGPLAGGALADTPVSSAAPGEGSTAPITTPTPPTPAPAAGTGSAAEPSNTSATTTPQPSTAQPSTPQPSAPQPAATPAAPVAEVPTVVLQRKQKTTPSRKTSPTVTATHGQAASGQPVTAAQGPTKVTGPNGVAQSPQAVAAQASALAAELATSAASVQALGFYRIPLFLLPIYRAAAIQYGVPWQILAAINEVETDYGSDQSVSSAGAEGWMQFEPSTWLQYGVDALDAGYADPYNPVDAVFAAARYLHAAGASKDLRTAILAYNHSEAYADSVLLRAKLISSYPKAVIATLTGLVDARLPVTGKQVSWGALLPEPASTSSATANAKAVAGKAQAGASDASAAAATTADSGASAAAAGLPGSAPAPAPTAAASAEAKGAEKADAAPRFVELMSAPNASVVAVQDGLVLGLGRSHRLGKYVILRDIYGDVFTYAGLGSIAPRYRLPKVPSAALLDAARPQTAATGAGDTASGSIARAGGDAPVTLRVKRSHAQTAASQDSVPAGSAESVPAATGKVRLFANPGNPDALAAAARVTTTAPGKGSGNSEPLRRGSLVAEGTVLGRVLVPKSAKDGHLRFAVQPAGDTGSIDPRPVLANWKELAAALHPQGAKGQTDLLGATASDVFLLSKRQLELAVLSDPGVTLDVRARHEVASGAIDRRVLAVLAFLSRSGLKPTVEAIHRGPSPSAAAAGHTPPGDSDTGGSVDISAINGIPIAGHEGAGSIADSTIRTLLTLQGEYAPSQITSLMKYPAAANTLATRAHAEAVQIDFQLQAATLGLTGAKAAKVAHAAASGKTKAAPAPFVASPSLSLAQWDALLARIGAIPAPKVAAKPTSAAIRDPQAAPNNRGLGSSKPTPGG
jgi:membrane-bound lytic murein transglycosylase B